jgi:O-antigen ligase
MFLMVLVLTASRAGLGSLLLLFTGFFLVIKSAGTKFFLILLIIITLIFASYFTTSRTDQEGSSRSRIELLKDGIYLFKSEPIRGFGFMRIRNETGGMMLHNTYLQAFVELGVLGGGALIFYLCLIGHKFFKIFRNYKNLNQQKFLFVVFGFYIAGLFYMNFGNQLLTIFFFLYLSLIKITINITEIPEAE